MLLEREEEGLRFEGGEGDEYVAGVLGGLLFVLLVVELAVPELPSLGLLEEDDPPDEEVPLFPDEVPFVLVKEDPHGKSTW